jgi:hypothetical protein
VPRTAVSKDGRLEGKLKLGDAPYAAAMGYGNAADVKSTEIDVTCPSEMEKVPKGHLSRQPSRWAPEGRATLILVRGKVQGRRPQIAATGERGGDVAVKAPDSDFDEQRSGVSTILLAFASLDGPIDDPRADAAPCEGALQPRRRGLDQPDEPSDGGGRVNRVLVRSTLTPSRRRPSRMPTDTAGQPSTTRNSI